MGAIGTPDQVRELIRRYEEVGVDQLIFVSQAGRNRHEDICESMELFAREVLPEFAERADAAEAAKEERLGRREGGRAGPPPAAAHAVRALRGARRSRPLNVGGVEASASGARGPARPRRSC